MPDRVRVRRRPDPEQPDAPWLALLVDDPIVTEDELEPVHVGRFPTMREAVTRGCTALRFVSAGIPWREGARARRADA